MKRQSQRGIALIITVIMLSVVTFMAVVFLAVSRREKASVTVTSDLSDARLAADAALARAQSEVVSRILAATNAGAFDMLVSTNLIDPLGFRSGVVDPLNVNYDRLRSGGLLNKQQRLNNMANLQYDARPPVCVRTNVALSVNDPRAWDFRYYLDLNRNGLFEDTGVTNAPFVSAANPANRFFVTGDPQWIGLLERPDRRHSETNRFLSRYAFLALPAGKSLDVNFIHNYAKRLRPDMSLEGFSRHQGVGSWELNLAGFLADLNTNVWNNAAFGGRYAYNASPAANSIGRSFFDANQILKYRYGTNYQATLLSAERYFGLAAAPNNSLSRDRINSYSDAPLATNEVDNTAAPWSGTDSTNSLFDAQELYNTGLPATTVARLLAVSKDTNSPASLYNRYTFYRMLSQLGVDSRATLSNNIFQTDHQTHLTNKFNLSYQPVVTDARARGIEWNPEVDYTPLRPGNATNFFYQVADRVLRASLTTNIVVNALGRPIVTNFMLGELPVRHNISITNIQVYHPPLKGAAFWTTNIEYSASLHRVLQTAANIYDATTSRSFVTPNGTNEMPTVFRPVFQRAPQGAIYITGFLEVTNAAPLRNDWLDLNFETQRQRIRTDGPTYVNVYGVPWIIGAKKGLPNFNEFSLETAVQVSRKVELRKIGQRTFLTNQMYVVGISNVFGIEAWNSYTQAFRRPVDIVVTNRFSFALSNVVGNTTNLLLSRRGVAASRIVMTNWLGTQSSESFVLPVQTNFVFLTNAAYLSRRAPFLFDPQITNSFESSLDAPRLRLYMTNRLQYWVVDRASSRVLDFVNLDAMNSFLDITQALVGDQSGGGGGFFRDQGTVSEGNLWLTNRLGFAANAPTLGLINQLAVAQGDVPVAADVWRSHPISLSPSQRQLEIDRFKKFLSGNTTNSTMQAPFTPTRKIYQRLSWQANDPLVHYTVGDLFDPYLSNPNSTNNYAIVRPASNPLPQSNLRLLNERYQPWGGNPQKQATGLAYSMAAKDPGVTGSDVWSFPTNKFPNVGWLGRVHRGTPWQTIYLKSHIDPVTGKALTDREWLLWSGSYGTHPTNDWKLVDLFTVAPNANAARGLLSVNQTNTAAWSAALSGVHVLSNSVVSPGPIGGQRFADRFIEPSSPQMKYIVDGINVMRNYFPNGLFEPMGNVLATPELTVRSPFLNLTSSAQFQRGLTDEAVERIPQQIMSLLKADEPRIVVYAFGQSLKPAERSLVTSGNFYNICTNYQITGEVVAKAVFRIEDAPLRPRVVVESYNILPPD
ncbi:MAG: hypothetical protein EXS31_02150 [Pedosphaera sp.]|nr:hypothetical protein [Pedosphaera sp.]